MSALRLTFGVDPGLSGAIVTLLDGEPGPMLDMPTFHNGTANEVDAHAAARFIRDTRAAHPGAYVSACIERVRAMPNKAGPNVRTMGAQSSFNFGDGFGQVKAAFRVLGIQPVLVEARTWKSSMGLIGTDKDAARLLAITRFPDVEPQLRRKKDGGRADALWIALWHDRQALERAAA
jgi:crossover junction endodeoxyribonuclease RuvC